MNTSFHLKATYTIPVERAKRLYAYLDHFAAIITAVLSFVWYTVRRKQERHCAQELNESTHETIRNYTTMDADACTLNYLP
jgi:hypothetical protein